MRAARPGIRVPQARGLERAIRVAIDRRERYPWRFSTYGALTERRELPVGDYGVFHEDRLVAAVERKTVPDLAGSLSSGKLALALAELSRLPHAMLIVEGRLSDLLKVTEHLEPADRVRPGWLLNLVAALQVEYPRVAWCFAETRLLAQDLAYRWLAAALHRAAAGRNLAPAPSSSAQLPMFLEAGPDYRPDLSAAPLDAAGRREAALAAARDGMVWTTRSYAERFGVGLAAARDDLKALAAAGELIAEGNTRARRYRRPET